MYKFKSKNSTAEVPWVLCFSVSNEDKRITGGWIGVEGVGDWKYLVRDLKILDRLPHLYYNYEHKKDTK